MSAHCGPVAQTVTGNNRLALVGSPNSGKSTLFNALTGLRTKTGNYPGVTVARYEGLARVGGHEVVIEDLPGTYSLDPISPDEQVVADALDPDNPGIGTPDGILVTIDATTLRRSLGLLAQVMQTGLPICVVLTFRDELARRGGTLDVPALRRALGVPVVAVTSGSRNDLAQLRSMLLDRTAWERPVVPPPTDPSQRRAWVESLLQSADYQVPEVDHRTRRIDAVLLHPLWGTLIFFATMFAFFQIIFTVATPLQDAVQSLFDWLGTLVTEYVSNPLLSGFLGNALIGGLGSVVVFLPQIALLFLMISLLEGSGYLSRAAFLMDRLMSKAGLEGRAFVALLSSLACAIPGIMATRSLPSAKDRFATMMGAPLMTCSARLTVYVLLTGLLVSPGTSVGPFGAQGIVMFALYLVGALSAMATAWVFKRFSSRGGPVLPFYMEMPSYRLPRPRSVAEAMWSACKGFLHKVGRIILLVTVVMWLLLSLPMHSDAQLRSAGVDPADRTAVSAYEVDHSYAADIGHAIEPVFEPLGFDWRINIGVLGSLSAREVFVATLGQVAAAQNPDQPAETLAHMTYTDGPHQGEKLFTPATTAALLVFFLYALQCMSTVGVMRRETGSWRWPAVAFGYMFVLAWTMAFLTHTVVGLLA
ncbi:ferrous iron transporter B [Streptomyces nodosus]|uniref:Ferrous iron transporter B n=1 Tax=Streptomyces nodosus TaxID=40318 RepID=A0A0B5DMJ0_9ACTN|nr:ferrous iron transporter B [Streptomyces nodosus]AJE42515.1 iron transporter FeoB [Streptomyces nodosus]MBB4793833.1 ferrous iron transport protein B [Streptomyces nodosus]QEV41023.1 ferrous iron transporter B [Streptomyces nodosus]